MNGAGLRKCQSWIGSFLEYTESLESPSLWRQWTAISVIASVMERKVWVRTTKGDLHPNLYTVLVGYAGTGKSVTIAAGESFLRDITGVHIAPTSMSMAAMVDTMLEAKCTVVRPNKIPPLVEYHSLCILADELSALIHTYDREFMAGLTKIYDGGFYGQSRRGKDLRIKLESPQLNILAGTTPSNLIQFMPEGAWEQGFASRIVLIFSADRHLTDLFDFRRADPLHAASRGALAHDLQLIYSLFGEMEFADDAIAEIREWRAAGEKPTPTHPKLVSYCARRTSFLIKLCMVASASRGGDMKITVEDYRLAKAWMLGAEEAMPDIFSAGIAGGDSKAMDEGWYFVWARWAKVKKAVPEHELIHFMRERVPSHSVLRVIEIMEKDGTLKGEYQVATGVKLYSPGPRKAGVEV